MASITINLENINELENAKLTLQNNTEDIRILKFIDIILSLKKREIVVASTHFVSWVQSEGLAEKNYFILVSIIADLEPESELRLFLSKTKNAFITAYFNKKEIRDLQEFLSRFSFNKNSSKDKLLVIGEELVAPFINFAYNNNHIDAALYLEQLYYSEFISKFETDEMFKFGMAKIVESAAKAGKRMEKTLNPLGINEFSEFRNKKTKVGFFFHNASMLAHIENIFTFLSTLIENEKLDFEPIIICMGGRNEDFSVAFSSIGVEVLYVDIDKNGVQVNSIYKRLLRLRELCQEERIDKLAWGCLSIFMTFAFNTRMAPEQIWWSQKWTGLSADNIDKYIYSLTPISLQNINGNKWLGGWFQRKSWVGFQESRQQAPILKEKIKNSKNDIVLGSLARTDKMSDLRYLSCVVRILKSHANAIYIWTGREKDPFIENFFLTNGVSEKTKFVGWVNTSIYADVIDVLLDSFPSGNGVTALQAMELGTPIVTMKSKKDVRTWDQFIGPAMEQNIEFKDELQKIFKATSAEGLYFCACNEDEYVNFANRLIASCDDRKKVGEAGSKFMELMMKDPLASAINFQDKILN